MTAHEKANDHIKALEAQLAEARAEVERLVEAFKSWNDHFFSMTDPSNWDTDMKGDFFRGYNAAMEELHEYCDEMFHDPARKAGAGTSDKRDSEANNDSA